VSGRRAAGVGVVVLAVAAVWIGVHRHAPTSARAEAVAAAASDSQQVVRFYRNPATVPAFTVHDLDGRSLSSLDWRGKVVIVNFWATWCGPCRAEIPTLVALQEKYRDRLFIIGVSEDDGPKEQVRQFATAQKINYPVVMLTPEIERLFPGVSAIPTSFVLDTNGRVVQKHVGLFPPDLLELETRSLAGLAVNARIEAVDRAQPAKLDNAAQATTIPGVDLTKLPPDRRVQALQRLNTEACTCGCDFTLAKCRIDDPNCGVSLPKAREIVREIAEGR
jgi:thiol-disulfide isomerase/thioredoxin